MSVLQKIFDASATASNRFHEIQDNENKRAFVAFDKMMRGERKSFNTPGLKYKAVELAAKAFSRVCVETIAIAEKTHKPLDISKLKFL